MSQLKVIGTIYSVHIQDNSACLKCATRLLQVKSFIMSSKPCTTLSVMAPLSFILTHLRSGCEVARREDVSDELGRYHCMSQQIFRDSLSVHVGLHLWTQTLFSAAFKLLSGMIHIWSYTGKQHEISNLCSPPHRMKRQTQDTEWWGT